MHLLLDTHLYLWWLTGHRDLSKKARLFIEEAEEIYISTASIWEASIKISIGKLRASINSLIEAINNEGFRELAITNKHVTELNLLPHHHRDPFDRMLVAQAISEPLRLLTVDEQLKPYSELVEIV